MPCPDSPSHGCGHGMDGVGRCCCWSVSTAATAGTCGLAQRRAWGQLASWASAGPGPGRTQPSAQTLQLPTSARTQANATQEVLPAEASRPAATTPRQPPMRAEAGLLHPQGSSMRTTRQRNHHGPREFEAEPRQSLSSGFRVCRHVVLNETDTHAESE